MITLPSEQKSSCISLHMDLHGRCNHSEFNSYLGH